MCGSDEREAINDVIRTAHQSPVSTPSRPEIDGKPHVQSDPPARIGRWITPKGEMGTLSEGTSDVWCCGFAVLGT
jgi:hypothetical protein